MAGFGRKWSDLQGVRAIWAILGVEEKMASNQAISGKFEHFAFWQKWRIFLQIGYPAEFSYPKKQADSLGAGRTFAGSKAACLYPASPGQSAAW